MKEFGELEHFDAGTGEEAVEEEEVQEGDELETVTALDPADEWELEGLRPTPTRRP